MKTSRDTSANDQVFSYSIGGVCQRGDRILPTAFVLTFTGRVAPVISVAVLAVEEMKI
jgi:hypothetical protein